MNHFSHSALGERPFRNIVSVTFKALLGFSLLAILTHISWNMFAPELFGLPETRMKGAMGLVLFAGTLSWVLGRGFGRRRYGDTSAG
jgi:hypothetical protein